MLQAFWEGALICLWVLCVLLLFGAVIGNVNNLLGGVNVYDFAVIITYVAILFSVAWRLKKFNSVAQYLRVGLILLVFAVIIRIAWISLFDSYQVSDFAWYFACGQHIAIGEPAFCGDPVIWQRSLFYTAPVAFLFGNSLAALEWINILIFFFSSLVFLELGRRIFGIQATLIGFLIFAIYPDYWYPVTLASHDNCGILWLGLFFLVLLSMMRIIERVEMRPLFFGRAIIISVILGFVITMMKYSRSYDVFAWLSLAALATYYSVNILRNGHVAYANRLAALLITLVVVVVTPFLTSMFVQQSIDREFSKPLSSETKRSASSLALVTAINVRGVNSYSELAPWAVVQYPQLVESNRMDFAVRKMLHQWTYSSLEIIKHLERKNTRLSLGNGNFNFATYREPDEWDETKNQVKRLNDIGLWHQNAWVNLFNMVVIAVVLIRFFLVLWLPFRREELGILLFSGFAYLVLWLVGESQPRYTIFLIFPFSYMVGQLVWALVGVREEIGWRPAVFPGRHAFGSALGLMFVGGVLLFGISLLVAQSDWRLEDLSNVHTIEESGRSEMYPEISGNLVMAKVDARFDKLLLGYDDAQPVKADSTIHARMEWSGREKAANGVEFFLTLLPDEFRKEYKTDEIISEWIKYGLSYCIYLNGQTLDCNKIQNYDSRFLSFSFDEPQGPGLDLDVVVFNERNIPVEEEKISPVLAVEYLHLF